MTMPKNAAAKPTMIACQCFIATPPPELYVGVALSFSEASSGLAIEPMVLVNVK
jgi:hypothetical protein